MGKGKYNSGLSSDTALRIFHLSGIIGVLPLIPSVLASQNLIFPLNGV